jgi:hypothetical protein
MKTKLWSSILLMALLAMVLAPSAQAAGTFFVTNLEFSGSITTPGATSADAFKKITLTKKHLLQLLGYPNISPSKVRVAFNSDLTEFQLTSPDGQTIYGPLNGTLLTIKYDGSQTELYGKKNALLTQQVAQYNNITLFNDALSGGIYIQSRLFFKKGKLFERVNADVNAAGTMMINSVSTPVVLHSTFSGVVSVPVPAT